MFVWKKYVYEVYKERSFTKAAQNLYISQPSLSARIKKIEEIIGEPLFDRSKITYVGGSPKDNQMEELPSLGED